MTGGLGDYKVQEPVHKTLHEEEHREQEEQAAALQQEQEQQLEQEEQHEHLREEDFEELDLPLVHTDPVFQERRSSLFRLRGNAHAEGGKKSARKAAARQAADAQNALDEQRRIELETKMVSATGKQSTSEEIVRGSLLRESILTYQRLGERVDVDGAQRHRNGRRFAKTPKWDPIARSSARTDIDNLTNNLRKDVCLQGDDTLPPELEDHLLAYYFTNQKGNKVSEEIYRARKADEQRLRAIRGEAPPAPAGPVAAEQQEQQEQPPVEEFESEEQKERTCKALEERIAQRKLQQMKLDRFITYQKSAPSNFGVALVTKMQNLRTLKLAKRQIMDEGNTPYHELMISMLDEEINMWQAECDHDLHNIMTFQDTLNTAQGQAQMAATHELAQIRRAMLAGDLSPEQMEELEERGRNVFRNFNFDGDVLAPGENRQIRNESVRRRW